jgi:hypothetical protein
MINSLMLDEKNVTAVSRYGDLVQILGKLDDGSFGGACMIERVNMANPSLRETTRLQVGSKPFIPKKKTGLEKENSQPAFLNSNKAPLRSPLIDLHEVPNSLFSDANVFEDSCFSQPNFDFLKP